MVPWIDSDRLGSTRIDSDRLGSTRIDSDRLGSTQIDSDRVACSNRGPRRPLAGRSRPGGKSLRPVPARPGPPGPRSGSAMTRMLLAVASRAFRCSVTAW